MKVLTLWEPWASLMVYGHKNIETRSWATKYRGPILIHAAKCRPKHLGASCEKPAFIQLVNQLMPSQFSPGCLLGWRTLVDIKETPEVEDLSDQEYLFGNYEPDRYAWFFDPVCHVFKKPLPVSGNRLLWDFNGKTPEEYHLAVTNAAVPDEGMDPRFA